MKATTLVVIALIGVFLCPAVVAWGVEGHKVVAAIAQSLLTDNAQSACSVWLGQDTTITDIAPQPDTYRATSHGAWSTPLHFVDMPLDATEFTMSVGCPNNQCVVGAILNYTKILKTTTPYYVPNDNWHEDTPSPLAFLVHFVGDVHQPLHVSYTADRGGNSRKVQLFDRKEHEELHSVWDTGLIYHYNSDYQSFAQELIGVINDNPNLIPFYTKTMDPVLWANSSFYYTRTACYNILPEDNAPDQELPYLADNYFNKNFPIIKQQLIAGGIRLASILNSVYASFNPNSPSSFKEKAMPSFKYTTSNYHKKH
jgi:hypothetical protein